MKTKDFLILLVTICNATFIVNAQEACFKAKGGRLYTIDDVWGKINSLTYSTNRSKTDITVEPGEHTFVFYKKADKTTYSFTVDIKKGLTYYLSNGKPLKLKEGEIKLKDVKYKKVSTDIGSDGIFWLTEKTDESNIAIIEYSQESVFGEKKGEYRLKKIDNHWGSTNFGYNSVWDGSFKVALLPGKHTLYAHVFTSVSNYVSYKTTSRTTEAATKIHTISYNFEAGKKYTIVFTNINNPYSATIIEIKK